MDEQISMQPGAGNRLQREIARLERFPAILRPWLLNYAIHRAIPFTDTAGIRIESLDESGCVARLRSHRKVHNHIRGIHAAASALLVETATGLAFGWHLPDDKLPLLKRLNIRYVSLAEGNLSATALLEGSTRARMLREPRGEAVINVKMADESGKQPLDCRIEWAWVPRKKAAE